MANYSLILNSKFRPFEYSELAAPLIQATQAHQQLEEDYAALDSEANKLEALGLNDKDSNAYKRYKAYSDDLRNAANSLAEYGLNPRSRQALLNLRGRFSKDITPIELAMQRREEDRKAQANLMMQDPTRRFNQYARNTSIDAYVDNPTLDVLSDSVSGNMLKAQVAQAARNLKTADLAKNPTKLKKLGLPFKYEYMITKGATMDQVLAAMANDPKALPALNNIVSDVMESSGIRNWSSMNNDYANNKVYQEMEHIARQGLYDAIGETRTNIVDDTYGMEMAKLRAQQRAAKKAQEDANRQEILGNIDPRNLYSPKEVSKWSKGKANIDKFKKYFINKNGTLMLTKKGMEELKNPTQAYTSVIGPNYPGAYASKNNFRNFIINTIGVKPDKNGNFNIRDLNHKYAKYVSDSHYYDAPDYTATKETEYAYKIKDDEGIRDQIASALLDEGGEKKLHIVKWDGKQFKRTGEDKSYSDLFGATENGGPHAKFKVTEARMHGNKTTYILQFGDKTVRVEAPMNMSTRVQENRQRALQKAQEYQHYLTSGVIPIGYKRYRKLSPADIARFEQEYQKEIQNAYQYESLMHAQTNTKDETYDTTGDTGFSVGNLNYGGRYTTPYISDDGSIDLED